MPAHVLVHDLRKRYGRVEAVRGVSFEIGRGEVFGLLGPNGAGKSTTIECLVGLREPDAGELTVGGVDVRRAPREAKQKIGVALQSTALPDQLTPREALRLFGAFFRERETPEVLIERFALGEKADARFATLSGGQRQRLALALAFVNRPELVVLDEPSTGLDPQARRELHASIREIRRGGCTVLLATHDLDEAEKLCDRVAIVDHGRVVNVGAPRELAAAVGGTTGVRLVTARPVGRARWEALPGIEGLTCDGVAVSFRCRDAEAALAALTALVAAERAGVVELSVRRAALEDVLVNRARGADEEGGA
ncbi:MAG: hypothetical protein RLZZ15_4201 [Verrucomicrobiota bacterium]|jgi:ABC-2 type transport system ATP-binding protein